MTERLTGAELGRRAFEVVEAGACYRLDVPGIETSFELDRLAWRSHELSGELLVRCALSGTSSTDGVLTVSRLNITSTRARQELAGYLLKASKASEVPWAQLLDELAQRTLAAERTGEPAVPLRDIPRHAEEARVRKVFGFRIYLQHANIIFGDGGSAKSLLALYMAGLMAKDGYRVLLLDWELDGPDHRERYETLFGEQMPANVLYTRCSRPLVHDIERVSRIVRREGIDFGVFDSVGFATHEAPETAVAALAYFQAVRRIGIGGIHIAHINKSEGGDQKPFGSGFWHNSARTTWYLKPTEDSAGLTIGVWCRKDNLVKPGQRVQPFAFEIAADGEHTTFKQTEITAVTDFAGKVPLAQRLRAYLKAGARTREEIAAEFTGDTKPDTLRRTLERLTGERGSLVKFPAADGTERYGLKASGFR